MERRDFLKIAFGVAAGAAAMTTAARAAPLSPRPIDGPGAMPNANPDIQPAVIDGDEATQLKPEQVHWHHHHRHHRHWGWRPRWHRRRWRHW